MPTAVNQDLEAGYGDPGTGPLAPPEQGEVEAREVDQRAEYVAGYATGYGVGNVAIGTYLRSLPQYIDDLTRDFGTDLYDRIMLDPQVSGSVGTLVRKVLAEGWYLKPALDPAAFGEEEHPEFELAAEIAEFCESSLLALDQEQTFQQVLDDLATWALARGNRVAELTFADAGAKGEYLALTKIKVKPLRSYAFVVDAFMNLVGLTAAIPGTSADAYAVPGITTLDPAEIPNLLPRKKFVVLTYHPKDGDPRGCSALRCIYDPWWRNRQNNGEELKAIAQAAVPSLVGTTPEGAQPRQRTDALGNVLAGATVDPEQEMANTLSQVRNGVAVAFSYGSVVTPINTNTSGAIFRGMRRDCKEEISTGITGQILATMAPQHQTRAASETQSTDVLGEVVKYLREWVQATINRDVLKLQTEVQYGPDVAERLAPSLVLGTRAEKTWAKDAAGAAQLGYQFAPEHFPALDERFGLPPRTQAADPNVGPDGLPVGQGTDGGGTGGTDTGDLGDLSAGFSVGEEEPAASPFGGTEGGATAAAFDFQEDLHPRDRGRFASKGGSESDKGSKGNRGTGKGAARIPDTAVQAVPQTAAGVRGLLAGKTVAQLRSEGKAELKAAGHPVNRLADNLRVAVPPGGGPKIKTIVPTKDKPMSAADHEAMVRMHGRIAVILKKQGKDAEAQSHWTAATWHHQQAAKVAGGGKAQTESKGVGTAGAKPVSTAKAPAPALVASTFGASDFERFKDADGNIDIDKAGAHIRATAAQTIAAGGKVFLITDGGDKRVELDANLRDSKGQSWGTHSVAFDHTGKERFEFIPGAKAGGGGTTASAAPGQGKTSGAVVASSSDPKPPKDKTAGPPRDSKGNFILPKTLAGQRAMLAHVLSLRNWNPTTREAGNVKGDWQEYQMLILRNPAKK